MCGVLGEGTLGLGLPSSHPGEAPLSRALRLASILAFGLVLAEKIDTMTSIAPTMRLIGHLASRLGRGVPGIFTVRGGARVHPLLHVNGGAAHWRTSYQLILICSGARVSRRATGIAKAVDSRLLSVMLIV